LRLAKSVVNVMRPYVETAVTGIQGEPLQRFCKSFCDLHSHMSTSLIVNNCPGLLSNTNSYQKLRPDDVLYLFETMGLLLGKTGLAPSEQQHSLARVIALHIQSMEEALRLENLPHDPEYFGTLLAGSVAAIAYLSKGFRRAPMEVQLVFAEPVRVSLAVLEALPGRDHVRAKVMILLQCMIQCIGSNVLPTMSRFVQLLIEHCTTDDVQDVAQLLNQLCIKFKEEAIPSVDPNLLPFLGKCHQLVPSDEQVAKGDIPPHLRTEQLSVKKLTFTVLQHIVTYRVSPVLLSPTNAGSLELVLQTMSDSAMHVDDPVMKKVCLTFFRELVDQWATDGDSNDVVSGFVRFVLQVFVPGMIQCFLSPSFNEKDAIQARNVTEFANILFILKSKQGNEKFEQYVVNTSFASAGCPQHVLEAFPQVSTVQEMELCLKETLKALKQKSTG
jgi:exportin-T